MHVVSNCLSQLYSNRLFPVYFRMNKCQIVVDKLCKGDSQGSTWSASASPDRYFFSTWPPNLRFFSV